MFHNSVANMPGPSFLAFYALCIAAVFIAASLYKRGLYKSGPAPELLKGNENEYDLAYLRRGERGVFEVAVLKLYQSGLLKKTRTGTLHLQSGQDRAVNSQVGLNGIELEVLKHFSEEKTTVRVPETLAPHLPVLEERLAARGLLLDREQWARYQLAAWLGLTAIVGLGLYKMAAAFLTAHFNVIYLCLMLLLTAGIYYFTFLGRPSSPNESSVEVISRWTETGKDLLERISSSCEARIKRPPDHTGWQSAGDSAPESRPRPGREEEIPRPRPDGRLDQTLLISLAVLGPAVLPVSAAYLFGGGHRPLSQVAGEGTGSLGGGGCSGGGGCGSGGCGGCGGCG